MGLSVVLATYNEEENIKDCLESVRGLADEIIIVDGTSIDNTVEIAKSFGAKVKITDNPPIFHINKQKALALASKTWILQLDADERVTDNLAEEIKKIITMNNEEVEAYQKKIGKKLFRKHQELLEKNQKIDKNSEEINGFFIPRLNFFLGKFLRYGGVYPDGVIRLVKKNKAYFPCKDVHEQMVVSGKVGWLKNDLLHMADVKFSRYLQRNNRYIDLIKMEMKKKNLNKNPIQFVNFVVLKPLWWFFLTLIIHKGILDGIAGIIFSFFSALRFPRAYLRYLANK